MAIIMIEDKEGLNNIEEILKVPGIGAVIFGPYITAFRQATLEIQRRLSSPKL